MMHSKVKCEFIINLDTGEYEAKFLNLSTPGEDIDYSILLEAIEKVSFDLQQKAQKDDHQMTRMIN